MARHRGWKRGDWLVMDEESGFTTYGTKAARDYYGVLKDIRQLDHYHPQDFIRAKEDPYPVSPINPPSRDFSTLESVVGFDVGSTTIDTPDGPALHLFRPALGAAILEYDFFVY